MNFVDYYKVLGISKSTSAIEIKTAFREQAKKWHPDVNIGIDVTEKMQLLNEAYLILKDSEARILYDIEYDKYMDYRYIKENQSIYSDVEEKNYQFSNETLERWISNARKQAVELAKQTLKEISSLSVDATKAAGKEMGSMLLYYFIFGVIILIIFNTCK